MCMQTATYSVFMFMLAYTYSDIVLYWLYIASVLNQHKFIVVEVRSLNESASNLSSGGSKKNPVCFLAFFLAFRGYLHFLAHFELCFHQMSSFPLLLLSHCLLCDLLDFLLYVPF